jgi:hypothetical protein
VQSGYETSTYGGSVPNAFAWQAGSKAYLPMGKGMLNATAEFSYANPWMYIRESLSTSYTNEHYLGSNVPGSSQYDLPCLGLASGPDSMVAELHIGYRIPDFIYAGLIGKYAIKGENSLNTAYTEGTTQAALVTPTGTAENTLTIAFEGYWRVLPFLRVGISLAYLDRVNAGHILGLRDNDLQASVGIEADVLALTGFVNAELKRRR